jgi:hypothetical protein
MSLSDNGAASIWNLRDGRLITRLSLDGAVNASFANNDEHHIWSWDAREVACWELESGERLVTLRASDEDIVEVRGGADCAWAVVRDETGADFHDGLRPTIVGMPLEHLFLSRSANSGRLLALIRSADEPSRIEVWDTTAGNLLWRFNSGELSGASIAPDGERVVGFHGSNIWVWDGETGVEIFSGEIDRRIYEARFSLDGQQLLILKASRFMAREREGIEAFDVGTLRSVRSPTSVREVRDNSYNGDLSAFQPSWMGGEIIEVRQNGVALVNPNVVALGGIRGALSGSTSVSVSRAGGARSVAAYAIDPERTAISTSRDYEWFTRPRRNNQWLERICTSPQFPPSAHVIIDQDMFPNLERLLTRDVCSNPSSERHALDLRDLLRRPQAR